MLLDLQYLGLNGEDIKTLKTLARAQHPKGNISCGGCICGAKSNGSVPPVLCVILKKLEESGREARADRPPKRDAAVCDHMHNGKSMFFEWAEAYMGCELCGIKVLHDTQ